jgi:hypothetical protein
MLLRKIGLLAAMMAAAVTLGGCPNPNTPRSAFQGVLEKQPAKDAVAASQTKISSQATLNTPSTDSRVNPTATDGRRSETSAGHPQY